MHILITYKKNAFVQALLMALIAILLPLTAPPAHAQTAQEKAMAVYELIKNPVGCIQRIDASHATVAKEGVVYELYVGPAKISYNPGDPPPPPSFILIITKKVPSSNPLLFNDRDMEGINYDPAMQGEYEATLDEILMLSTSCATSETQLAQTETPKEPNAP